ncbi:hypothetical protein Agabi119p4_2068 [Agaricus bisporus var. burnettii]|uniref:Cyclin N-terminal domain-containing protein n=1 Tax=Agaricus bisporus var. burnettii TaxID=192524 RepID=A0A8H7F8H9_AGABI|nr:hypothetical protein Agabi119p4_2068 [Agaricus bisporus var. burnettii]
MASIPPSQPEQSRRRTTSVSTTAIGAPRARPHNNLLNPATPTNPTNRDPYYGHEKIARISARFITHLFACPESPPTSGVTPTHGKLPYFIADLKLVFRLHAGRLVICDDTYSNKSWTIVAQGMFSLREVNQMEREMCGYLDWEIVVDNETLTSFEGAIRRDFSSDRDSYPSYPNVMVSRRAALVASTTNSPVPEPSSSTSPVPGFSTRPKSNQPTPSHSPSLSSSSPWSRSNTPDTPPSSYSNSASPASSGSPRTPGNEEMSHPQIKGLDQSPQFQIGHIPSVHPLKGQMFAFALPSSWYS